MQKVALFIGRFQPFHNGHLDIIKRILKENKKVIIVVGSTEHSFENKNPLTALERKKIIKSALKENGIKDSQFKVVLLKDLNDFANWANYVLKNIPKVDVLYTGSTLVKDCFSGKYSKACKIKPKSIKIEKIRKILPISGTLVRGKIKKGQSWESLVSKNAAKLLKKWKIANRLK
jgi:nicotinamide-nucleotide adenylyltransferase